MFYKFVILVHLLLLGSCISTKNTTMLNAPTSPEKYLIITADDFGASKNINEGIKLAAQKGYITTISAFTNFEESIPELKTIAKNYPNIGIGAHLNITTGKPILTQKKIPTLINTDGNFYTIKELLPRIESISIAELRLELHAQVSAFKTHSISLDHISDHCGILSLYTPFFELLLELSEEFNVPLRNNYIAGVKYPKLFPHSQMKKHGNKMAVKFALRAPFKALKMLKHCKAPTLQAKVEKMDEKGIAHPDVLIDYLWGDPSIENLRYIMENLPPGISELVVHIGTNTRTEVYPSGLDIDYFTNRELELKTLGAFTSQNDYADFNIKRIGFSDIMNAKSKNLK